MEYASAGLNVAVRHKTPRANSMSLRSLMIHLFCIFTAPVLFLECYENFSSRYAIEIHQYYFLLGIALLIGLVGLFSALRKSSIGEKALIGIFYSAAVIVFFYVWSFSEVLAHARRML